MIAGIPGIGIGMLFYVMLIPLMALMALKRMVLAEAGAAAAFKDFARALAIVMLMGLGFWLQLEIVRALVRGLSYFTSPVAGASAEQTVSEFMVFIPFLPVLILAALIGVLQIARAFLPEPEKPRLAG